MGLSEVLRGIESNTRSASKAERSAIMSWDFWTAPRINEVLNLIQIGLLIWGLRWWAQQIRDLAEAIADLRRDK
jgi:hypothetical protein